MAVHQQYRASVTFESGTQAPETVRVEFVAASPGKAASTAVREARRAKLGKRWTSMVILLEKVEASSPGQEA